MGDWKKQEDLFLCSGLIQTGLLGRVMIKGNPTYQEFFSLTSENHHTKTEPVQVGITAGSSQTKAAFNEDDALCHLGQLCIF